MKKYNIDKVKNWIADTELKKVYIMPHECKLILGEENLPDELERIKRG